MHKLTASILILLLIPSLARGACGGAYTESPIGTFIAYDTSLECVQAAVTAATDAGATNSGYGNTVILPSGTDQTWTSQIAVVKNIRIIGQGKTATKITCSFGDKETTYYGAIEFTPDAQSRSNLDNLSKSGIFEVSGIWFDGSGDNDYVVGVKVYNSDTPVIKRVRIHDCKFSGTFYYATRTKGYIHGVFDNNEIVGIGGDYHEGVGSAAFANDFMTLGSGSGWYIEDNTFTDAVDGINGANNSGGGFIIRYNTVTGSYSGANTNFEVHGNQKSSIYGPQIMEAYGNSIETSPTVAIKLRGGKNIMINNQFGSGVHNTDIRLWEEYSDEETDATNTNPTGPDGMLKCIEPHDGTNYQVCTSSCICQKIHNSYFLNNRIGTVTGTLIVPTVSMDYRCREATCVAEGEAPIANTPAEIVKNREYFYDDSTNCAAGGETCSSGVGCGTYANRPGSCTVGTGYWVPNAMDDPTAGSCSNLTGFVGASATYKRGGTLYICGATGWADGSTYTPYTYPHPLRGTGKATATIGSGAAMSIGSGATATLY